MIIVPEKMIHDLILECISPIIIVPEKKRYMI